VKVFRQVDGDKPLMRFFYDDLDNAREEIKENLNPNEKKYIHIWNIINKR